METAVSVFLVLLFVHQIVGPPVTTKNIKESQNENEANSTIQLADLGIEYNRYLSQVVEALESDPEFKKKLETAEEADIRSGKIAQELELVHHNVRTKLDELKREELTRLRHLARLRAEEAENDVDPKHLKAPEHVDHSNPHSFEIVDLHKLISKEEAKRSPSKRKAKNWTVNCRIKVTHDLAVADEMRRTDFKEYEMQKEFEKQEKLKQLDEEHRKEYLHTIEEQKTLHDKHAPVPIHHPGSKPQLKEVWEKQDHMETQDFNPKAFFYMHDLDGNGVWDQDEVKTLFLKELDKMYQAGAPEDDMRERAEEMERMREHVFGEMDVNKDNLISFQEFLQQTKNPEFERDPGWETVDHQQVYTPEEYAEFERRRQEEIERLIAEGKLKRLPPPPHGMQPPGHINAQVPQYQGQPQYQQGQNPPYNMQQGQPQAQQAQYQPQQGQYQAQQQAYQGQQYQSNNIPQQQPQSNYIPHQQQPPSNIQQQQQQQQQQPLSNNVPQQQQQPPQQQQKQPDNNIPQAPVQSNFVPQSQQNQKNPPPPQPPINVAAK